MSYRLRIADAAQNDIVGILRWSHQQFGPTARQRYETLIKTALRELVAEPMALGSHDRPEIGPGVRSRHLRLSRRKTAGNQAAVGRPRHFILYRIDGDLVVIGRVLHDSMDLSRLAAPDPGDH